MPLQLRALLLPILIATGTSQAQQWQWAEPGSGAANAYGTAITTDAQGNVVVAGTYNSTIGFEGQLLSSPNEDGIFLAKFTSTGTLLWLHIVANGTGITVRGVTCDDAGDIALVGMYQGSVAFIPGQLGTTLTSAGSFDVFVAAYDAAGSPLWANSIGGPGYDYGASICHDGYSNFFVTGDLHETAFNLSSSKVFVTKFAYNGTEFWTNTSADYGVQHLGDGICANDAGELCGLIAAPRLGGSDDFDTMVKLYKSQDIGAMATEAMGDEFKDYADLMLNNRNANWIPKIGKQMRERPTLFAVGAGHLGGEKGVVRRLRLAGWTVEPVRF
mgnify:CR=1 FL=1